MDAYIFKTGRVLTPWGDPVASAPVLNVPLEHSLPRALSAAGALRVWTDVAREEFKPDPVECLLCTEDLWITPELAEAFVNAARATGKPSILAIPRGLFTDFTTAVQQLGRVERDGREFFTYPLVWLPGGARWKYPEDLTQIVGAEPIEVDLDVRPITMPVHRIFAEDRKFELPLTHKAVVRVTHWMHVLRANQLGLLAWGSRLYTVHPVRILWAALRAMSINQHKVMQKLVTRGRGCEIHPSAVVEASTLGDNVKIGANAVVRFSHLGDGVSVSDQCNIQYSVLGQGSTVARMGMLQSCVLYPGANSGHYGLQLCVVGKDTFVGGECILGDFKPGSTIKVMQDGELIDTKTNTLGCAVGHDCAIMMRATFYAGREIPNGVTIIGPPGDVVAKVPPGLPTSEPLMAVGGILQPYSEFSRTQTRLDTKEPAAEPAVEQAASGEATEALEEGPEEPEAVAEQPGTQDHRADEAVDDSSAPTNPSDAAEAAEDVADAPVAVAVEDVVETLADARDGTEKPAPAEAT